MVFAFIIVIIVIIAIATLVTIYCFHEDYAYYRDYNKRNNHLPIKFSQFVSLYNTAPKKWIIPDNRNVLYQHSPEYIEKTFYFSSVKDLKKYEKWFKNKEKFKKELQYTKSMQMMLEFWQKDIEECMEKGRRMLDKSLNL